MDCFIPVFSVLSVLVLSVSYAALPAPDYWKTVLPDTPMPSAIQERIHSDALINNEDTSVNVGHGVVVNTWHKGKPVHVHTGPFIYNYAASDTQLHDDPQVTLFFLEKDLHPNTKMKLHFTETTSHATFIPLSQAKTIPFSSAKLPQILDHFAIDHNSLEAKMMNNTLRECELPALDGETKYCATSLEAMVEFSTRSLGTREVTVVSTTVGKEGMGEMEYRIKKLGVERMKGNKLVVCHSEEYKYAVFYCHVTSENRAYSVKMVASNGAYLQAVAVCHTNTAGWNPKPHCVSGPRSEARNCAGVPFPTSRPCGLGSKKLDQ